MSFYEVLCKYSKEDINRFANNVKEEDVYRVLSKESLTEKDFLTLLSKEASKHLEAMAKRANVLTMQHFGKTIQLFTPMYLANYCVNRCVYCGFNSGNQIERRKLEIDEVEKEAEKIASTGLKHIIILTGECRSSTPPEYIADCVKVIKKYFTSIAIEVYPLTTDEYEMLVDSGVDSLTMFQEVYDSEVYDSLHLAGPKKDYRFRLDAPERGCKAKMVNVNIGALLGLNDLISEAFFTGLHAAYLQDNYPDTDIAVSLPRMRPQVGGFEAICEVSDRDLVQIMMALRIYRHRLGITISTRENSWFRDNLIGLGVTKMSAGASTEVGGHTNKEKSTSQFQISDERSVDEMIKMLYGKGYQPVLKDWGSNGKLA